MTKHLTHARIVCGCGQKLDYFFDEELEYACPKCGAPLMIDHAFPGIKPMEDQV